MIINGVSSARVRPITQWLARPLLLLLLLMTLPCGGAFAAMPVGLQDITAAMANGSPTLASFVPGFSLNNTSGLNLMPDDGNVTGATGLYLDETDSGDSGGFSVVADGATLRTFDLTAMGFANYTNDYHFTITVTGHKLAGGTVTTTIGLNGFAITPGNYGSFTGLTSFDVSIAPNAGNLSAIQDITFDSFTIANAALTPTVTNVSPASGPDAGGTAVTVTGNHFLDGPTPTVTVGGAAATGVTVVNNTTLTATTPAGVAGATTLVVANPAGSGSATFTYLPLPVVTGVAPQYGPIAGNTSVTITGTSLSGASVSFGGTAAASITSNTATQIVAVSPAHAAGTVDITVTTANGTSATGAADRFTFVAPPTVATVSPATGSALGGTSITITGTNFVSGQTGVTIGGAAATGTSVVNSTTLTATTPAGTPGATVDVVVTTPGGSVTDAGGFSYNPLPAVTGLAPNAGPAAGGVTVVITGTHLTGATGVSFGGTAAAAFTVNSDTQITATAPAGAAGTVHVTVTSGDGTSLTGAADQFTWVSAPTVTAVSPVSGPTAGGNTLTITGTNFTGATAVSFGGTAAAAYTVDSATSITATVPAHAAGAVHVTVTTAGGTSATGAADQYTYVAAPTVTGINPSGGPTAGGTSVAISGTGFSGATAVSFGGTAAAGYVVNSATSITATAPAGTGTAHVTVTTAGGTSATGSADQFTWYSAPTFSGISPDAGPTAGGTTVVLTGTYFTGATGVTFGGTAASGFTVVNDNTLTVTTPAHAAGTVNVVVTNPGGSATGTGAYTYYAAPTLSGVSPSFGPVAGGTTITIGGTNFINGSTTVTVGGAAATVSAVTATSITATTPAGTAGARDVVVTTPGGSVTSTGGFTYYPAPGVSGISPGAGPLAGGTSVTLTGSNFTGATGVTIGGAAATGITVVNATTITATTPAGTAGARDVVVTTPGGSGTLIGGYTYASAPTVTGASPSSGPQAGGTTVVLTGTHLTGATAVTVGGAAVAGYTVDSATQITLVTPAGTPGARNVVVTTAGGTATGAGLFTYIPTPAVSSVSPTAGPVGGGGVVTLTGTNLSGATAVHFGATAASGFTVGGATQITATVPAHAAGTVHVTVTTPGGTSATSGGDQYTYVAAPTITSVTTGYGAAVGVSGTSVSLTGANLTGATAVYFGASAAAFTVNSATSITATAPAHAPGTVHITVVTAGGTSATGSSDQFRYMSAAVVTGIGPTQGPEAGGTAVTITGLNFTAATGVTIGGAAATEVSVVNDTTITAVTPAGTAGARDVVVAGVGGNGTNPGLFTYLALPTVTGVTPGMGPLAGGTPVTITGTNFTGATSVTIGGAAAASYTVDSPTQITATTPAGTAGAKDVVVTNAVGSGTGANLFTYVAAPTVTGATPGGGPTAGGTAVEISGTNFVGVTAVTVGGSAVAGFTVDSATRITVTTPAGTAGAKNVVVTAVGGVGTGTLLFTYYAAPTVTGISPASGPTGGGAAVTLSGTNFVNGATTVTIGGAPATVSAVTATSISATTPAGVAGARDVVVTTPGGSATGSGIYTYVPTPTVTAVAPARGVIAGGTSVTLTGTSFTGATAVTFGGTAASSYTVNSDTQITAVAPAHGAGTVAVAVTTPGGTGTGAAAFTYVGAPTIGTVSPDAGGTAGGTAVTLTGTNFLDVTGVTCGGAAATVTGTTATTISLTTPAHAAGAVNVVVTTAYGTVTAVGAFTYRAGPTVTALTPNAGDVGGGTAVVITGTGFTGAMAVTLGGTAVSSFTVDSATRITATTSAHGAGAVDVVVTTPYGSGTGAGLFTYAALPTAHDVGTTYTINTPLIIDLAAVGGLGSGTSVEIVTAPRHGTATVAGTQVTYTPRTGFFGADSFRYVSINAGLTSPPATVRLAMTGTRPDPTEQPDVAGMVENQRAAAMRFARAQLTNLHQRLESLHGLHRPPADDTPPDAAEPGQEAAEENAATFARGRAAVAGRGPGAESAPGGGLTTLLATSLTSIMTTSSINVNAATEDDVPEEGRYRFWGAGNVRFGTRDAEGRTQGTEYRTDGLTFGADRGFGTDLIVGVGLGYGHDESEIGSNGSESTSDATTIALYGSYQPTASLFIDGLLGYGHLRFDSRRYVESFDQSARAERAGTLLFGAVTGGYEYRAGGLLLSPYLRHDISVAELDAVTERGADEANLSYSDQSLTSRQWSLGLRGETEFQTHMGPLRPGARLEYQRHTDGGNQASVTYADLPLTRYSLTVPETDADTLLVGLGGTLTLEGGANVAAEYQWTRSNDRETSWGLGLRFSMPLAGD